MKKYIYILLSALFIISCEKEEKNPKVTTISASPISASSCKAAAAIDERGSYTITDHGFICYYGSSDNIPNLPDSMKVSLGTDVSKDTFSLTFLLKNNLVGYYGSNYKWFIRSYISNEKGIVYGNAISFSAITMSLSSVFPSTAKIGDTISIYGNNFDNTASNNKVQFRNNSTTTAKVVSASKTELKVIVPNLTDNSYYSSTYDITVTSGSQTVTLYDVFTVSFSVTSYSPNTGTFGSTIYIYGTNLYQVNNVLLGNTSVSYNSYSGYLTVYVPTNMNAKKFKIYVVKNGVKTEVPGGEFSMNSLTVSSFTPTKVSTGNSITIYGTNFNNSSNTVFIGSSKIVSTSVYSSYIICNIPSSLGSGDYEVSVSNGLDTLKLPGKLNVVTPIITGISPSSGYAGSELVIKGHNLNTNYQYVYFNGYSSNYGSYVDSTTFKVKVPSYTPGTYRISLYNGNSQYYSPTDFTILEPKLTSVTPTSGAKGTAVIITGEGFGTSSSNVYVTFGNVMATVMGVNNTQINAMVPSTLSSGTWMITVSVNGYAIPTTLTFTIP